MSIKECLEAFVAHVQALKEEDEALEDGYTKEFQMLKQQSNQYRMEGTFSTCEGEREYNRRKNRYKDILPFDYTRVVLPTIPGLLGSDYINANFIKGATGENAYIASQGPLSHTVADFWRMIWDYRVKVIVMTANEYEGGKMKCACYWPKTPEERQYGDISVTLVDEKERGSKDFIVRQLCAKRGEEVRLIHQLHYIAWPDHAVPASVNPLLEMVALARDIQPDDLPPLLIHCSAGCGRTGTLCAIDYAWTLLKMGQITPDLSLYDIIFEMRRQRPSSVQALDQYILVHHAVSRLFSRHLALINQHYNLPDNAPVSTDTTRAEEGTYENIPSTFVDTSLDLPEVSVSAPASLSEDHYANLSAATTDVVQKAIRDTVANLLHAASTAGLQLVPSSGQKPEPLRYQPSPRIRARRNEVENGYAHITLKHPLPIPRKSRMERNSSSSSSRSSTSSISGGQTEPAREPIKSEPDYAVLSQFKSGDVPTGPAGTPIILQADGGEFMNTGTGTTKTAPSQRAEYENPCIVFTSPGAVYENAEGTVCTGVSPPVPGPTVSPTPTATTTTSTSTESCSDPDGQLTGSISAADHRMAPTACSPHSSQGELRLDGGGTLKMENNPLYEETQPSSHDGFHFEENALYEQSSASVREKWRTMHRTGGPHSPGSYDIPPFSSNTIATSSHIPSSAVAQTAADSGTTTHPRQSPKSPMISENRSPEARRKPQPLPKPKTPTSPDRSLPQPHLQPAGAGGPAELYTAPEKKTPTSSPGTGPSYYSYADPNALGKWSLQHLARGVPHVAVVEGDYAQLKNPSEGQPAVPPRSTSAGHYDTVAESGAYSYAGNGQRESLSDDEGPGVPPKNFDVSNPTGESAEEDSFSHMSRSLETLGDTVTTGVLTFGRKLKQKVQQTFGKTPGSPPEGLMMGSPPGTSGTDPTNSRGMSIFYKGMDISFPHRVPAPRGPRSQTGVTSPDGPTRNQSARH